MNEIRGRFCHHFFEFLIPLVRKNLPMQATARTVSVVLLSILISAGLRIASAAEVNLAWDSIDQPELSGYLVFYGTQPWEFSNVLDVGNVTTYTVFDLGLGRYFFAVKAYGKAGEESPFSNEVSTVISEEPDSGPGAQFLPKGDSVPSPERELQSVARPVVEIRLERKSYVRGETVKVGAFRISNPTTRKHEVEVKIWLALPGIPPVPLDLGPRNALDLTPGFTEDYGSTPVLQISVDAPSGTGAVHAVLIDKMTGLLLSEGIDYFTINEK